MNPFMMQMINPMGMMPFMGGMGFMMPMCGCSNFMMSMPFSQDDNLWFMNSPIYRDTRYDYLLDPNLALQQCQLNWQNGNIFGSTMLPGFTFPGFTQIPGMPGLPGLTQQPGTTKTEEEKAAEKKKEEEAKKPAAQKAQKMNEVFNKIKKLAEDKNNNFPEIPEELVKKAEEAMKKETAAEQLAGMKEVFEAIPVDTLRKTILADDIVRNQLRKAGYNFNMAKYSLKNNDINQNDIDHADRLRKVHSDIANKNYNELQVLCGQLADTTVAKARVLGVISTWNDKYKGNEKGILRYIASNLPTGNDAVAKSDAVKECVKIITLALLAKADEYEGYEKISKARDEVSKKLTFLQQHDFNQANINSLADACDTLYARLRMQEAVTVRNEVSKNFKFINDIKEGVITDKTIIEETQKDLEAEGIAYPKVNELDATPVTEEILVQEENEMKDLDEEYKGDGKGMLEAIAKENDGKLTKVQGKESLYQTRALSGDNKIRYFGVVDNKVYEVFKTSEGKFVRAKNAEEITAVDINSYDRAVQRANKLVKDGALDRQDFPATRYPIFKAACADEYYIIKDNKFYHIVDAQGIYNQKEGKSMKVLVDFEDAERKGISLDNLTADDVEEFNDEDLKTRKQQEAENKAKAEQEKKEKFDATAKKYTKDKVTLYSVETRPDSIGLAKTGVYGYYKNIPAKGEPTVYFKYDNDKNSATYQKLVPLYGVSSINPDGTMVVNGVTKFCQEVRTPETIAKDMQKIISRSEYKYNDYEKRIGSKEKVQEDLNAIKRGFNTLKSYKTVGDIMQFFNSYKDEAHHWYNSIPFLTGEDSKMTNEIFNNKAISEADKKEYIKLIATRLKQVVDKKNITFENPDDNITLETISKGGLTTYNYENNGISFAMTAAELGRIMEIVLDKYNNN